MAARRLVIGQGNRWCQVHTAGDSVPVVINDQAVGQFAVSSILP
jgi:hypothetical protein